MNDQVSGGWSPRRRAAVQIAIAVVCATLLIILAVRLGERPEPSSREPASLGPRYALTSEQVCADVGLVAALRGQGWFRGRLERDPAAPSACQVRVADSQGLLAIVRHEVAADPTSDAILDPDAGDPIKGWWDDGTLAFTADDPGFEVVGTAVLGNVRVQTTVVVAPGVDAARADVERLVLDLLRASRTVLGPPEEAP